MHSYRLGGGGGSVGTTLPSSLTDNTTTTNADLSAARALAARGVVAARQVAALATPDLIGAWCAEFDRQAHMGPGALVAAIRSGARPPGHRRDRRPAGLDAERWLREHVPEVCDPDPHPEAVLMLRRLRFRYGGAVSAKVHGAVIRAAVKAAALSEGEGGGEGE